MKCNHIVFFSFLCMCMIKKKTNVYLLVVKFLKIPMRILPSLLMWLYKIAFSGMSLNICDCIKWVVKCQTKCTIEESNIRSWQQRTSDVVDFVPSLTKDVHVECACEFSRIGSIQLRMGRWKKSMWKENKQWVIFDIWHIDFLIFAIAIKKKFQKILALKWQIKTVFFPLCAFYGFVIWFIVL